MVIINTKTLAFIVIILSLAFLLTTFSERPSLTGEQTRGPTPPQHRECDRDNDEYMNTHCKGNDCNDHNPNINPGITEVCTDLIDNNCNNLVDCNDPQCASDPACSSGSVTAVISTPGDTMPIAPYTVMFSSLASISTNGDIVDPEWNFGDSNPGSNEVNIDKGMIVAHRYDNPGTYTVTLTVTDVLGQQATTTLPLTIQPFTGTTYYVSFSTGNDANNGLSPSTAWKTLSKAFSVSTRQNNPPKILLKRGDTWQITGTLSVPSPSIIDAYGTPTDPRPIIEFTTDNTNGVEFVLPNWPKDWGYSATLNKLHIRYSGPPNTNMELVGGWANTLVFGNAIRNTIIENGGLYVQSYDSTYPQLAPLFVLEDSQILYAQRQGWYASKLQWIANRRNTFIGSGSDPTGTFDHQNYWNQVINVLVEDSVFDCEKNGLANSGSKANSVVNGRWDGNYFTGCRMGMDGGLNPDESKAINDNVIVENNVFYDNGAISADGLLPQVAGIWVTRNNEFTIRNNIFHGHNWFPGGNSVIQFSGNDAGDPLATIKIYNNIFYDNNIPQMQFDDPQDYQLIDVKNNIFYITTSNGAKEGVYDVFQCTSVPAGLNSDHNTIYWNGKSVTDRIFTVGCNVDLPDTTLAQWQSSYGHDQNSQYIAAQFASTDPTNPSFLQPTATSPVIDAGTVIPEVPLDKLSIPRPQGPTWDTGAFEFVP